MIHFVYACSFSQNNTPASPSIVILDFYSNSERLTIVLLSKYIEQQPSSPWYSPNYYWKMLSLSDPVTTELCQSRSCPKFALSIPVPSSRYMGKCAARVLQGSDPMNSLIGIPDTLSLNFPINFFV